MATDLYVGRGRLYVRYFWNMEYGDAPQNGDLSDALAKNETNGCVMGGLVLRIG